MHFDLTDLRLYLNILDTGGDVAGVEDVQVEAQVGEVEVHRCSLGRLVVWTGPFAGKPRSYKDVSITQSL